MRPIVVVANKDEKKNAIKMNLFGAKAKIVVLGEGFYNTIQGIKKAKINKKTPLINFGTAGSRYFEIGAILTVDRVKLYHSIAILKDKTYKLTKRNVDPVVCFTNNDFTLKDDTHIKNAIFDMELYYLLALGYNVIKSVKVITDDLNYGQYKKSC